MPSKSELKSLGERRNYQDRELDARAVSSLSSDEYLWFQTFFPARLEHAAQIESNKRQNAERMPVWNARRMWKGKATPEEDEKARAAGDQFAIRHPQFARTIENATLMIEYMQAHDLDATDISSYTTAFRELSAEGKLTLVEAQSATDFYKEHKELHPTQIPPLVAARNAKKAATEKFFAEARADTATARAGATRVTDYGHDQQGVPPYSDIEKISLRNLVRNMSSAALDEKCQHDPSFKKALDSLE
jgi:hypothetical protein